MRFLKTIFKRPKILFLTSAISITIFFIVTLIFFNDYIATAKVAVISGLRDKETDLATQQKLADRAVRTTAEAIKNQYIIKEVVKKLNLEDVLGSKDPTADILSMLEVRPLRGTDIIEISVKSKKRELAVHITNAIAEVVVLDSSKRKFSFEKDMLAWLNEQASVLRNEVEKAAEELRDFENSAKVGDIKKEYDSIRFRIKNLRTNLAALRGEIQEAEAAYNNMQQQLDSGKRPEELLEVKTDDSYRELESEYLVVKKEIERLSKTYQSNHPDIVKRTKKLDAAKELMEGKVKTIVSNINQNNQILKTRKEDIESMIEKETKKLVLLEKDLDKYNSLLNALREKDSLYASFIKKSKDDFGSGVKVYNVDIIEQAYLPLRKNRPPFKYIILFGLICGVIVSAVYNSIKSGGELPKSKKEAPSFKGKGMYIERVQDK